MLIFFKQNEQKIDTMEEFERVCCIRGYHIYKEIWEAAAGEVLMCKGRPTMIEIDML